MHSTRFTLAALALACLPALASAEESVPEQAVPAEQAAPATAPPAAAETGTVIFFREWKFAAGGLRYKVREGNVELCKLANGTYCVVTVPVGRHEYTVHSEAGELLTLEVESGDTYYLRGDISAGLFGGHPHLLPSDQATFESMSAKLADNTGKDLAAGGR